MIKRGSRGWRVSGPGIVVEMALGLGLVRGVATAETRLSSSAVMEQTAGAGGQSAPKTVWARVFSEQQAARGAALYVQSCTSCHRDDLSGREGPSLQAPDFFIRWRGQTLAEMLDAIRSIMPEGEPDSLSQQAYLDIIGFLFKYNGVPLGTTDLAAERPALERILVTEKPAQE